MERRQTALIIFMRHGQKDKTGSLTDTGLEQARSRGVATKNLDGDVLLFHSGVGRVRDTIVTMSKYLHVSNAKEENYVEQRNIIMLHKICIS